MQPVSTLDDSFDMPSRTTWYLLTPTLVVSGLLLAVGLGGAWYVHQVNLRVSDSLVDVLAATQSAEQIVLAIRDVRVELHRFINDKDPSHLADADASLSSIEHELGRHESAGDPSEETEQLSPDLLRTFRHRFRGLGGSESAADEARDLVDSLDTELLAPAERVLKHRHQMTTDATQQNQGIADRIGLGLLLLGISGAAAGILIGFVMARGVHRSLVEITVPVRDIAGRLNEVVGPIKVASNTDLTELDGALRVLADKTSDVVKRLQASQQETLRHEQLAAVGQLAAGLAHELRNPLMSVKLIVQAARERVDASLSGRDLAVIEDEVTRLERMLQTVLDFARPPQPEKQLVDIRKLVGSTLDVVYARAGQQDVVFHWSGNAVPMWIEADESQLRQVILNLLLNALDALPSGGNVWLRVDYVDVSEVSSPYQSDEPCVVIRVADDGSGVSPDVIERIFEPFVSTKATGIGLGLSTSRRIVESHNGMISVRNREQGGAEFSIYLPVNSSALREVKSIHADAACH